MSQQDTSLSRHVSYNNRFRSSASDVNASHEATVTNPQLPSLSAQVELLEHLPGFDQPMSATTPADPGTTARNGVLPAQHEDVFPGYQPGRVLRPMAPGQPRRISRQSSCDTKCQAYVTSRSTNANGNGTFMESDGEEVFVEMGGDHKLYTRDTSLFPSHKRELVLSSSSSSIAASSMPNVYNRLNHHVHDAVWCCGFLYFVFFCCIPAIHLMERSDVEFQRGDLKAARRLGRLSTVFFVLGAMLTLSTFAFIFFLAIYFTT